MQMFRQVCKVAPPGAKVLFMIAGLHDDMLLPDILSQNMCDQKSQMFTKLPVNIWTSS